MADKVRIYSEPIKTEGVGRREGELRAEARLIARIFGKEARLVHDSEGRPRVENAGDFRGMISISHCATTCVVAVTDDPSARIGVDIEMWRGQLARTAPRFLTETELRAYTTPLLLLLAWTTKEAVYKAAFTPGLGLREIHLPPLPPEPGEKFAATARGAAYGVNPVLLTPENAITTAIIAAGGDGVENYS